MDQFWTGGVANRPASAKDVLSLKQAQKRAQNSRTRERQAVEVELEGLRSDLEFVSLMLGAVFARLDERGTLTRQDLRGLMISVDEFDGALDGRLAVNALRELVRPFDQLEPVNPGE